VVPYVKREASSPARDRPSATLRSWDVLSAAIRAPNLSFILAREVLRDLGRNELSFSVALHAFVTHPDLSATITEAEGLIKLRAWVGIACLLSIRMGR
jgi:hypothetical protein